MVCDFLDGGTFGVLMCFESFGVERFSYGHFEGDVVFEGYSLRRGWGLVGG